MDITVYTTDTCPSCVQLKKWLNYKQYKYKEIKVDHTNNDVFDKTGMRIVPITRIGDNYITGLNYSRIISVLRG